MEFKLARCECQNPKPIHLLTCDSHFVRCDKCGNFIIEKVDFESTLNQLNAIRRDLANIE